MYFLNSGATMFVIIMRTSSGTLRDEQCGLRCSCRRLIRRTVMLVARKSRGIKTYADMNNKKVNLWEGVLAIQPRMFFRKYNLKVKIIPQSYSINPFLRGGTDVASAMWYNEYHTIINSGLDADELTTFFFHSRLAMNSSLACGRDAE
ncbi:MAG: ABC transporter substrate-binding protein [Nitrospirae bacterium]|nr:ABC transporter substrate-binding protein [Nitrospirota bacterium]